MSQEPSVISHKLSVNFPFVTFETPLREYCSLRVGGPAWAFAEPENRQDLVKIYKFAKSHDIPVWILGRGSSVIPHDNGFRGLVVCTRKVDVQPKQVSTDVIEAACGVFLPRLAMFCQKLGLSGLEWSIGIPGTVGGAVWMNAGASGYAISMLLEEMSFWDGSEIRTVHRDDIQWGNRYSSFQDHPNRLILSARLRLRVSTPELVKRAIRERLDVIKTTQPRSKPSVGTVFRANRKALPALAAGLQVGSMICCPTNPDWINNLGNGTASDAYELVRRVMWRHLWRGLPMPKIEPVFLPYDPRSEASPAFSLNDLSPAVRFIAKASRRWRFLFKRLLTDWRAPLWIV